MPCLFPFWVLNCASVWVSPKVCLSEALLGIPGSGTRELPGQRSRGRILERTESCLASWAGLSTEGKASPFRYSQLLSSRFLIQDLRHLLTLGVCLATRESHSPSISHLPPATCHRPGPGSSEKHTQRSCLLYDNSGSLSGLQRH